MVRVLQLSFEVGSCSDSVGVCDINGPILKREDGAAGQVSEEDIAWASDGSIAEDVTL